MGKSHHINILMAPRHKNQIFQHCFKGWYVYAEICLGYLVETMKNNDVDEDWEPSIPQIFAPGYFFDATDISFSFCI